MTPDEPAVPLLLIPTPPRRRRHGGQWPTHVENARRRRARGRALRRLDASEAKRRSDPKRRGE